MPAVAVTEHGNMFSAVDVSRRGAEARRQADPRLRGVRRAGQPDAIESGTPGETANHLVLLAETNEGYHNLIKLVSSGYTEGFYYKPRIDKELLAQHAKGLIGLSSCLKGEVATGHPDRPGAQGARGRGARTATSSAPATSSSRCRTRASRSSGSSTPGCCRSRASSACRSSCTNDVHYLRQADQHPHDVLLCIGTGKNVSDEKRLQYHGDQFFLKTADEMRQVFGDYPEALANTRAHRRALQRRRSPKGEAHLPELPRAGRLHARRRTSSTSSREGFAGAARAAAARSRPRGDAAPPARRVRAAA